MFLHEALKSGRRIRNLEIGFPFNDWTGIDQYGFSPKEVLSEDWDIQPLYTLPEAGQWKFYASEDGKPVELVKLPPGAKVLTKEMINHAWPFYKDDCASYLPLLLKNLGFNE